MQVPSGCNTNGLDTIHNANARIGIAAPRQILDVQLFRWSPFIPDEFGDGISSIRNIISLPHQGVQGHPN
jgi:hypothetical protein